MLPTKLLPCDWDVRLWSWRNSDESRRGKLALSWHYLP